MRGLKCKSRVSLRNGLLGVEPTSFTPEFQPTHFDKHFRKTTYFWNKPQMFSQKFFGVNFVIAVQVESFEIFLNINASCVLEKLRM